MERLVRLITQQYVKLLPPDQEFYTPQDLYDLNIPDFLVERMVLEMNINLSGSIIPPHSEWTDMAAESVQNAWQQFLDAIAEEHRMPAPFAASVFETAIADVLELALQPRKAIPEAIFGRDEQLDIDEIRERIHNVTIHRHLASAVIRYMERKQKVELSLTECKLLIGKIDEKLIENYNPLNWAQVLSPVFILAGPAVDTNLFRVFFEDKGRNRIARKFDLLNTPVDKNAFIELLSSPETDPDAFEDDQSTLFDVSAAETGSSPGSIISKFSEHSEDDPEDTKPQNPLPADEESEDEEDNDTIISTFGRQLSNESEQEIEEDHEEEEDSDELSLHSRFIFDTEAVDEEGEESDEGETTLYKELKLKQDLRYHDREEAGFIIQPREKKEEEPENDNSAKQKSVSKNISDILSGVDKPGEKPFDVSAEDSPENDDEPIWQAFLAEQAGKIEDVDPENIDEEGFIDEPVIDLMQETKSEEKIKALAGWLKDDEKRFVSAIFGDSQSAYEEALEAVYDFDDWKSASRYIEKEIFARNFVDVYDEVAVDFTDRLHTFFMEFKSSKMNG